MARDLGKITVTSETQATPTLQRPERPVEEGFVSSSTLTGPMRGRPSKSIDWANPLPAFKKIGRDVADFFTGGTQAVGQDIASAITAPQAVESANKITEADSKYISTVFKLRKEAEKKGQDTKHWDDLIKNYKPSGSVTETIESISPALNKSSGEVAGDFARMGLEAVGGASFRAPGMATGQLSKPLLATPPAVVSTVNKGNELLQEGIAASATKAAEGTAQKNLDYALELTAPKLSSAEKATAISRGQTTAPGIFKPARVTPSRKDELVAESVQDIISPKKTVVENIDSIGQEISRINNGVEEMIASNKAPFNVAQLRSQLNRGSDDLKLIFASDANAEKTYKAVMDAFIDNVKNKDTLGLFQARQSFDQIPAIKKLLESEGLGENVKREVVLNVRRAANEFIASLLPANNPYKPLLLQETRMLEALTNIGETNVGTLGKNKIQLLTEKYPVIKGILGTIGAALGLSAIGVGSGIIGSTDR